MTRARRARMQAFTLVELLVALALLGLMSSILFGSLSFAGRSWDAGEDKAVQTANMRMAQEFLRAQLEGQRAQRLRKVAGAPILFGGERDAIRYAASLPPRVQAGGIWAYRLSVGDVKGKPALVLARMIPDPAALSPPDFADAETTVIAEGIKELRIAYLGRDPGVADGGFEPSWRDRWDDKQRLPLMLRIEVIPVRGEPWPTMFVAPRESPEASCRAWDNARQSCVQA